ncbi:MAG: DUF6077 domain-containing protein [Roseburia sp.]|nr:DUF6077 domain-containing protein [Roseburia sp.]
MEILNGGILAILVLPMPFLLGLIPVKYMNSLQRTPAMAYVCGWFVSFSVFEAAAVPFILLEKRFSALVAVYTALIVLLTLYSAWSGRGVLREFAGRVKNIRRMPLYVTAGWLLVFLLIGGQLLYAALYEYYDGDDAYYIATAVLTDTFDTMYLRDAYTGYIYDLDVRHAFSPTPIYQAWLSRLSGIAPAAVAHTALAAVWLLLMYCVYGQIGNRLFPSSRDPQRDKSRYRPVFMLLIVLWFAFGNISLYTAETFAMTRTWQGKGLMAGTVLPALFLCLIYLAGDRVSKGLWMLFVCVIISAVFATSIAFMLIPTIVGVAAALTAVRQRSLKRGVLMCLCCIPCLLLGGCYLLMR